MSNDPDDFESARDVADTGEPDAEVHEFPVDTSTAGKHYEVAVPDYIPGRTATQPAPHDVPYLNSYFHLGVPHSGAGDTSQVALGEDLLLNVTYPDGFDLRYGGVRDHTDGNRIITTRQDRIEIVRGQSRTIVRADQDWAEEDSDWAPPATDDAEPSVEDHIYPNLYYEIISTTYQPGTGGAPLYGEPRRRYADVGTYPLGSTTVKADFYEYVNGTNVVEVYSGSNSVVDKLYGGRLLEVISTVHATHGAWEEIGLYDGLGGALGEGGLVEYVFAKNLTEVIRAEDLLVDKIYGDRILEVISTWDINSFGLEKTPTTLISGDIYEYLNASHDLVEVMRAQNDFREEIYARNITEFTVADLNVIERIEAKGSIEELTTAIGGINELTIAGGELVDVMMGGVLTVDIIAAVGCLVEILAGIINVEIVGGVLAVDLAMAPVQVEVSMGTKTEYAVEHFKLKNETAELAAQKQELTQWRANVSSAIVGLYMDNLTIAEVTSFL